MIQDLRLALIIIGLIIILVVLLHEIYIVYENNTNSSFKIRNSIDKQKKFFNQRLKVKILELEKLISEITFIYSHKIRKNLNVLRNIKNKIISKIKLFFSFSYFYKKINRAYNNKNSYILRKKILKNIPSKHINKKITSINLFTLKPSQKKNNNEIKTSQFQLKEELKLLTLHVINYRNGNLLDNKKLFKGILKIGFQFGEMNIFHRHLTFHGNGPVLFSLANIVKPGSFNFKEIYKCNTFGISIFMILPSAYGDSYQNFKFMLQSAQCIADECNGVVLDNNRNMITPQKLEEYRHIIQQTVENNKNKI